MLEKWRSGCKVLSVSCSVLILINLPKEIKTNARCYIVVFTGAVSPGGI